MYSYDTHTQNSLLMATNRNRLLAGKLQAHEGSYEQVDSCLRFGAVDSDKCSRPSGIGYGSDGRGSGSYCASTSAAGSVRILRALPGQAY